ncbi:MAG: MBL fold metallo-hydrolase [Candidatus Bathyarchaeota archaeon]|nr:MBL fold metallo-hydrolase [Candidatus Bathyarchaeota archaeon]
MLFKQIKCHGDNFSYIIADEDTGKAAVVDPSFNADTIIQTLKDEGLEAKYVINTHSHIDHTAGNQTIKSVFNAKIVAHKLASAKDISIADGDILRIGKVSIQVIHTPGHTPDSVCLLVDSKLLTGDTLFVGECGRTDLLGGSAEQMYHSLFDKLMKLADSVEVYPGHDYGGKPWSTIGVERRTNYTLERRTLEKFLVFMSTE